jgi:hypothetical protein
MKIFQLLLLVLYVNVQAQAQRDTFPLIFDYSIGLEVTHDVQGYCECAKTTLVKEVDGYQWTKEGYINCIYLDSNQEIVRLEKVWVKSEVPEGDWIKTRRAPVYRGIKGFAPLSRKELSVIDTFYVFMTYESGQREMVYESPGECYCKGMRLPSYSNGEPGATMIYNECTWVDYGKGVLTDSVRMLVVEGFPEAKWRPDKN